MAMAAWAPSGGWGACLRARGTLPFTRPFALPLHLPLNAQLGAALQPARRRRRAETRSAQLGAIERRALVERGDLGAVSGIAVHAPMLGQDPARVGLRMRNRQDDFSAHALRMQELERQARVRKG